MAEFWGHSKGCKLGKKAEWNFPSCVLVGKRKKITKGGGRLAHTVNQLVNKGARIWRLVAKKPTSESTSAEVGLPSFGWKKMKDVCQMFYQKPRESMTREQRQPRGKMNLTKTSTQFWKSLISN